VTHTSCLCCGGALTLLIDFGPMPLANTYDVTQEFLLKVNRCTECFHLQLSESVDPQILFHEYSYFSGTSKTALAFFEEFADLALSYVPGAKSALDIACNDGTQLDAFKKRGLTTDGVDPAANIVKGTRKKGHVVREALFEEAVFPDGQTFDIITAQNVIAHTPRPLEFLKKCAELMHEQTQLFVTCSQANMIQNGQCDTIYHEHVSYFNTLSMMRLVGHAGLLLNDIRIHPMHGQSYIFVIAKRTVPTFKITERFAEESLAGLFRSDTYDDWLVVIEARVKRFRKSIADLRNRGFLLVGCGAAAKGISLLNMADEKLDLLIDTTPAKIDKVASGMLIHSFGWLLVSGRTIAVPKIAFVVLAWNFYEEIVNNVKALRNSKNDVFITP